MRRRQGEYRVKIYAESGVCGMTECNIYISRQFAILRQERRNIIRHSMFMASCATFSF